jgi:diguanylate cyclase (GGDEF)-like protein
MLGRPNGPTTGKMTAAVSLHGLEDARHVAFCLAAAAAILWRARTTRGDRRMWTLIGIAALCDALALGLWTYVWDSTQASAADALFVMFYILNLVAFARLLRDRVGGALRTFSFDALGIAVYLTAIGTAVFGRATMDHTGVGELQAAGYVGYVALDAALFSVIFAVSSFTGRAKGAQDLVLGAAFMVTCVGDSLFVLSQAGWIGDTEWAATLFWEGGLIVLACAAFARPPRAGTLRVGGWWESVPTLSWIAAGGGVLVASVIWDMPAIVPALGALTLVLAAIRARRVVTEVRNLVIVRAESLEDELTGLPNQRALFGELELLMRAGGRDGQRHTLLIGHLEGFSELTDTLGHEAAQQLLRHVADRLRGVAPGTLARLDRDELATIVEDDRAEDVAAALEHALTAAPLVMDGIAISVRPVFGYACFPDDAQTVAELARRADVARRDARARGLDIAPYDPARDHHSRDRLELAADLRAALRVYPQAPDSGLWLALQPQIELATGDVVGVEALIRWQHPARGPISPAELLPVAERSGLMSELTDWVLDRALADLAALRAGGHPLLRVSVNVSAITLVDVRLATRIGAALTRHGVPPEALTVEVTEDAVMADHRRAREVLSQIAALGVEISIDDFGTGHSSLGQLRHVPADELKIDRRFVSGMAADPLDEEIVRLVVALGRRMGLRVVAEGIETDKEELMLRRLGCDLVQGFGVGRPMGAADLARWLRDRRDQVVPAALHG